MRIGRVWMVTMNGLTILNGMPIGKNKMNKSEQEKRNQEYYDRKMKHREEMIPYLAACFGICLLLVMVAGIVNILGGW